MRLLRCGINITLKRAGIIARLSRAVAAILVASATLSSLGRAATAPCKDTFADSASTRTLQALERIAAVAPVWDDYSLKNHPLLLVADSAFQGRKDTPVCAAIWRSGKTLMRIELPERPPFSTPLYGMIDSDPVGPRAIANATELSVVRRPGSPALHRALRQYGITRVVVLNVPLTYAGLGRLGPMLESAKVDLVAMQADLAVHESFHLHSQFPTWLDQTRAYAWPAWDRQPDRVELRQRCYGGSPGLVDAMNAELRSLVAAFDALQGNSSMRDPSRGLGRAREFIELRLARRRLQDTLTVALGRERISCGQAEDLMELEEGTTQWLGHRTAVEAGLTSIASLRGSYAGSQAEKFYQTGPLQLWILEAFIGPDALRNVTRSIARSSGPDGPNGGVFAQFEFQVRRLPVPAK